MSAGRTCKPLMEASPVRTGDRVCHSAGFNPVSAKKLSCSAAGSVVAGAGAIGAGAGTVCGISVRSGTEVGAVATGDEPASGELEFSSSGGGTGEAAAALEGGFVFAGNAATGGLTGLSPDEDAVSSKALMTPLETP